MFIASFTCFCSFHFLAFSIYMINLYTLNLEIRHECSKSCKERENRQMRPGFKENLHWMWTFIFKS